KLGLPGWALTAHEVRRGGFRATKADVEIDPRAPAGPHRSLGGILGLLDGSSLPARVRSDAARIFSRLAEAEARAHGTSVEAVHFHDVGALDAIIDVTGAVAGLQLLGVESVQVSALPIGGGSVAGAPGYLAATRPAS